MSCCNKCPSSNACSDADIQVLILQVGTAEKQTIIQIGKIKYTTALPGEADIVVQWPQLPSWTPDMKDSNGNSAPLLDGKTYCVQNVSCSIAKFGVTLNNIVTLAPISLSPKTFLAFTTQFDPPQLQNVIFETCCPETSSNSCKPSCQKRAPVSSYNGGRSPGLITCALPQQKAKWQAYQVASSCSCSNCN